MRAIALLLLICLTRTQYYFETVGVDYGSSIRFTPTRENSNPTDPTKYTIQPPVEVADDVFRTPPRQIDGPDAEPLEHEVQAAFGTTPFSLIVADTSRGTSEDPEYFRQLVVPTFQQQFIDGMFEREVTMCTSSLNRHLKENLSKELTENEKKASEIWEKKVAGLDSKHFKSSPHQAKVDYMAAYLPDPKYPVVSFFLRGLREAYVFRSFNTLDNEGKFFWPVLVDQNSWERVKDDAEVMSTNVGYERELRSFEKALNEGDIVLLASRGLYQAFLMPAIILAINALAKNTFSTTADAYKRVWPIFEAVRDIVRMRAGAIKTYLEGKIPLEPANEIIKPLTYDFKVEDSAPGCLKALRAALDKESTGKYTFKVLDKHILTFWYRNLDNCANDIDEARMIVQMFTMPVQDLVNYNYQRMYPPNKLIVFLRNGPLDSLNPQVLLGGGPGKKEKGGKGNNKGGKAGANSNTPTVKMPKIDGVKAAEVLAKAAVKFLKSEPLEHLAIGLQKITIFHPFDKMSNEPRSDSKFAQGANDKQIEDVIRRDVTVVVSQLMTSKVDKPVEVVRPEDPQSELVIINENKFAKEGKSKKESSFSFNYQVYNKAFWITSAHYSTLSNLKALYGKIIAKGKSKFEDTQELVVKAIEAATGKTRSNPNSAEKVLQRKLFLIPDDPSKAFDSISKLTEFVAKEREKQVKVKSVFGRSLWRSGSNEKVEAITGGESGMSMKGFFKFDSAGASELNGKLQRM